MQLVLGSKSPRRKELLEQMGYSFEVRVQETDEHFPCDLDPEEVPLYIAKEKARALMPTLKTSEVLITSDTVVVLNKEIMGKPLDRTHAIEMLRNLSGKTHQVITSIYVCTDQQEWHDTIITEVTFATLSPETITHYVDHFQPYDKAGAYGIQEWIGLVGVEKINGSYTNVVGLPTTALSHLLKKINRSASK